MWVVHIHDNQTDSCVEAIALNFDELQQMISYINEKEDRLELERVEQRWFVFGLDNLKEDIEDTEDEGSSNNIPDKV